MTNVTPTKTNSPLPVNSELNTFYPHQTLPEFTGRGVGGCLLYTSDAADE